MSQSSDAPGGSAAGIINFEIADQAALRAAYMPFITNGGLFIPRRQCQHACTLGDEVFLLLRLVEQGERLPIAGKVVWITPDQAQGPHPPGFGIQFSSRDGGVTQQKLESLLGAGVNSERPTHTL